MTRFLALLTLIGLAWLVGAWVLMLLVGELHHEWWPQIPTISYSGALKVEGVLLVGVVLGAIVKALAEAVGE